MAMFSLNRIIFLVKWTVIILSVFEIKVIHEAYLSKGVVKGWRIRYSFVPLIGGHNVGEVFYVALMSLLMIGVTNGIADDSFFGNISLPMGTLSILLRGHAPLQPFFNLTMVLGFSLVGLLTMRAMKEEKQIKEKKRSIDIYVVNHSS